MKFPLSWLREWCDLPAAPEEIGRRLTARGFPIEGIEPVGHEYAGVVVGEVLEVARHPDADKLSLCKVEAGTGAVLSIVCGATNVVPGMRAPVALVGAELPGGMKIKRSKIRGETSEGMLCSARELALGVDHAGILALAADAPIGRPVRELFGEPDVVIDVEIPYNRPDLLCIAGLARELSAAFEVPLAEGPRARLVARMPEPGATTAQVRAFPVKVEDPAGCPRYMAQVLRGVAIGASPPWLVERLERAGMRPVNNVVDITNYVMLELGHPLHAFDLAKLDGPEIVVRRARAGETMTTLDGRSRTLSGEHLVIADRTRPTVIAGVLGAAFVEVGEGTTDLLLEAAIFDPLRIQRVVSDQGILSEAARRYSRGVDPALSPAAMARACALIEELAGGRRDGPVTDVHPRPVEPLELELAQGQAARLLGVDPPREKMVRDLAWLGFGVANGGASSAALAAPAALDSPLKVTVPTWRRDVTGAVDLIEEVARGLGYDKLPEVPIETGGSVGTHTPARKLRHDVRQALIGLGFSECWTPSLADPTLLSLTWPLIQPGEPRFVQIRNPTGPENSVLRTDLVHGLLQVAAHDLRHGARGVRIFEVGRTFLSRGTTELPDEPWQVAALVLGPRFAESWDTDESTVDFFEAKGLFESFLKRLGVDSPSWHPYAPRGWKSGESAELRAKVRVACAGRLSPRLLRAYEIEVPLYIFVADLEALAKHRKGSDRFVTFTRLPGVRRDLAFFLPRNIPHARVEALVRQSGGPLLVDVRLFDVYTGQGVPAGKKSLAYTLTFQAADRTLAEAEIETAQKSIVEALVTTAGATLRDR